jgi:IclR family transcriptional regulator, KDG regulon repressor
VPTNNNIAVIERMMRVLENFQGERQLTLATLAARSKMVKSSVYRILFTLEKLGYIDKNGDGNYSITSRFARLAGQVRSPSDLPTLAQPFMLDLVRKFQETINLGVLDGDEVLYIRVLESPHTFRLAAHAGIRSPLHSTALGKALIASLPDCELQKLVKRCDFRRFTRNTICEISPFMRELVRVRRRGYAIDNMEDSDGARCLAAPIFDGDGRGVAALSISGPASRVHRARDPEVTGALIAVCTQISKLLGYSTEHASTARIGA